MFSLLFLSLMLYYIKDGPDTKKHFVCHRIDNCFPPRFSIQKYASVCTSFLILVDIFKTVPVIFFKFFSIFTNVFIFKYIFILVTLMLIFSNEGRISLLLNRGF